MTGPLNPTVADLQKWRRLVKQARIMAANPTGAAGDLRAAAAAATKAVAPSWEALKAICSPLVRLGGAFPAMDDAARRENVATLIWLAEALAPLVGMDAAAPAASRVAKARPGGLTYGDPLRFQPPAAPMAEDPRPDPAPRRDIFG